jgi:hypothetical protein
MRSAYAQQFVDDAVPRIVDVIGDRGTGPRNIALGHRIHDFKMFFGRLTKPRRDTAHIEHVGAPPQFTRHIAQQVIPAHLAKETVDQLIHLPLPRNGRAGAFHETAHRVANFLGTAEIDVAGRQRSSFDLEYLSDIEDIDELLDGEFANGQQPVEATRHQPLEFESPERLANRCAGNSKRVCETPFLKHGTGRQIAREHHVEQAFVRLIAQAFRGFVDYTGERRLDPRDSGHFHNISPEFYIRLYTTRR